MGSGAVEFPLLHVPGLSPVPSPLPHMQCTQPGFETGQCDTRTSPQVATPASLPPSVSCPGQDWPGFGPSCTDTSLYRGSQGGARTHPSSSGEVRARPGVAGGFLTSSIRATPPSVPPTPHSWVSGCLTPEGSIHSLFPIFLC